MARFAHELRKAEAGLPLPTARRGRVLVEVGQDLEDLYAALRARGMADAEARARAVALLGLSPDAVRALHALHRVRGEVWLDRTFRHLLDRPWERALLAILSLTASAGAVLALAVAWPASVLPVAVVAILAITACAWIWTATTWYRLYCGRDRVRGAPPVAGLAGLIVVLGALAAAAKLYTLCMDAAAAGAWRPGSVVPSLGDAASLLTLATMSALAVLLPWFPVRARVRRLEAERSALSTLMNDHPTRGES